MANFQGRRAPNVSQYIANLNTVPTATDMAVPQHEFGNFDDELSLFTDTHFFDLDLGEHVPDMNTYAGQRQIHNVGQDVNKGMGMAMVNQPNFGFNEFPAFPPGPMSNPLSNPSPRSLPPSPPNGLPLAGQVQKSQPTIPSAAHFVQQHPQSLSNSPQAGDKRNSTMASLQSPFELEESSRAAAEEDKRRRNTAASARFRVKKKQREQTLEKTAKELSEKVQMLEGRVSQLETENTWLKGLITERNTNMDTTTLTSELAKKAAEKDTVIKAEEGNRATQAADDEDESEHEDVENDEEVVSDRSLPEKKRGVGTSEAAVKA